MGSTGSQGTKQKITKQATQADFLTWANNKWNELDAEKSRLNKEGDAIKVITGSPTQRADADARQKKWDESYEVLKQRDAIFRGKTLISRRGRITGYEPIPDATRALFEKETGMQLSDGDWNALRNRWTSKFSKIGQ